MGRQEELALELDLEPEKLAAIDEEWVLKLMEKGVLVQLHIGYWRPYSKLKGSDLGISDDAFKEYIQLGRKKLLPPDTVAKLENIEKRARCALEENSFRCLWGRFVPVTAWRKWREENEAAKGQFYALRDEVIAGLPDSIGQLRGIYTHIAEDAYRRSVYDPDAEVPRNFINAFMDKCLGQIPSPDAMRAMFRYDEVYSYIPLPAQLNARMQEMQIDDMHRQVAQEMLQRKQEMIVGFLAEIDSSLREMVMDVCQSVRDSIRRNDGKLVPRSVLGLKNLLSKLERLNFHDDAQISGMIEDIRRELDKPANARDIPCLDTVLGEILHTCREEIREIESWRPSRYEAIELADAAV